MRWLSLVEEEDTTIDDISAVVVEFTPGIAEGSEIESPTPKFFNKTTTILDSELDNLGLRVEAEPTATEVPMTLAYELDG
jgi:hypothetical protein